MGQLSKMVQKVLFFFLFCIVPFIGLSCNKNENVEPSQVAREEKNKNENEAEGIKELKENPQKSPTAKEIGYAYGVILAKAAKMNRLDVDPKAVYKGLVDSLDEQDIIVQSAEDVLVRAFAESKAKYVAENLKKQNEFLEANKKKEDVKTLESGLQYKVLKSGKENGKKPKGGQKVKVIYEGKALGKDSNFDSSNGQSVEFSPEMVIEGWQEILPIMREGDEFEVYIPSNLGYKESGISYEGQEIIPPNALLIFKIELVEVLESEDDEPSKENDTGCVEY